TGSRGNRPTPGTWKWAWASAMRSAAATKGGAGPPTTRPRAPYTEPASNSVETTHPAPGEGRIPAAGCHRTRPRRPRGMPLPPLVSLAQPQIRALGSRVPMPTENLAGRSIAGYRLLERVREGGTAEAHRAIHPQHGTCA